MITEKIADTHTHTQTQTVCQFAFSIFLLHSTPLSSVPVSRRQRGSAGHLWTGRGPCGPVGGRLWPDRWLAARRQREGCQHAAQVLRQAASPDRQCWAYRGEQESSRWVCGCDGGWGCQLPDCKARPRPVQGSCHNDSLVLLWWWQQWWLLTETWWG